MALRHTSLAVALLFVAHGAWADETIRYEWKLEGFLGTLASIFVPAGGQGALSIQELADGVDRGELLITSAESAAGDFFRYGSEWNRSSGRTERSWSELSWRGEKKSKRSEVEQDGVVDVVSAIQMLRRSPPSTPRRMEIWSDGRLYPVLVLPRGNGRRRLDGLDVAVRHLEVRGLKVPDRKLWKGELDLWIADDATATPVEIELTRKGAHVRLSYVGRERSEPVPTEANGRRR